MRRSTLMWQLGLLAVALVVMVLNWVGLWEPIQDWLIGRIDQMGRPDAATGSL